MSKAKRPAYYGQGKFWERSWSGSIGHMKPHDIEASDAVAIKLPTNEHEIYLADGRRFTIGARKQNWSFDGAEVTKRTFERHRDKARAAYQAKERATAIAKMTADWRKSIMLPTGQPPLTETERAAIDAARLPVFRRARPSDADTLFFLRSLLVIPDDLRSRYEPLSQAHDARVAAYDIEQKRKHYEAVAVRLAAKFGTRWEELLERERAGLPVTSVEAGIDPLQPRPEGFPRQLFAAIVGREAKVLVTA